MSNWQSSRQTLCTTLIALPIATPVMVGFGFKAFAQNIGEYRTIRPTARVFTIRRFIGIVCQILIAKLVRLTVLHTAKPCEVTLSQVGVDAIISLVLNLMVHALCVVLSMEYVIRRTLVRMNDCTSLYHALS